MPKTEICTSMNHVERERRAMVVDHAVCGICYKLGGYELANIFCFSELFFVLANFFNNNLLFSQSKDIRV